MSTDATALAATHYMGTRSGKRGELTMFFRVKPGHEKHIREAIREFYETPFRKNMEDPRVVAVNTKIGVHDVRHVLFDNDTRLCWLTSFDTEWDPYIDDTFAVRDNWVEYAKILQHTVGAPEGIADPNHPLQQSSRAVKDIFNANRVLATGFSPTFPNVTVREIGKGERLRNAFEKVLEHPEAEQALQHPALRPLLDEAAE
jgi:hypothetical protein